MVLLHISVFFCKWWKIAALFTYIKCTKNCIFSTLNECWSGFLSGEKPLIESLFWCRRPNLFRLLIESLDTYRRAIFCSNCSKSVFVWKLLFELTLPYITYIHTFKFPVLFCLNIQKKSDESSSFLSKCFMYILMSQARTAWAEYESNPINHWQAPNFY